MLGISGAARAAVAAFATAGTLGGCASLQANPEYSRLPEVGERTAAPIDEAPLPIRSQREHVVRKAGVVVSEETITNRVARPAGRPAPSSLLRLSAIKQLGDTDESKRIGYELQRVALSANNYLAVGKGFAQEGQGAQALVLGAGFYGSAVTAFNPAPKNLLAALLAAGTGQAWSSALKPAERAKVYVMGYRSLDCVYSAGNALVYEADQGGVLTLRAEIALWRVEVERLIAEAAKPEDANVKKLGEYLKAMQALDATLALEQNALVDAPYRVARVRREIEAAVDKRISAAAPDYDAALKLLKEAAKPTPAPAPAPAPTPGQGKALTLLLNPGPPNTIKDMILQLPGKISVWTPLTPTRAADAYERMGECIRLVG